MQGAQESSEVQEKEHKGYMGCKKYERHQGCKRTCAQAPTGTWTRLRLGPVPQSHWGIALAVAQFQSRLSHP